MAPPPVSLSDLIAVRARMSRGTYLVNHADAGESITRIGVRTYGGVEEPLTVASAFGTENDRANVAGLVATHNAAFALIELAYAALELEALRERLGADAEVRHTHLAERTAIAEALFSAKDRYERARKAIVL